MSVDHPRAVPEAVAAESLLSRGERRSLAMRLTVALLAAGLLLVAILWEAVFPDEAVLANLVRGLAAALVAVPVLSAAWHSLRHPSLHGVTDQLIAMALAAAWATGELMTAAILPIVMIIGHVLEERSLIGSHEAIHSLNRLTHVRARRRAPGRARRGGRGRGAAPRRPRGAMGRRSRADRRHRARGDFLRRSRLDHGRIRAGRGRSRRQCLRRQHQLARPPRRRGDAYRRGHDARARGRAHADRRTLEAAR